MREDDEDQHKDGTNTRECQNNEISRLKNVIKVKEEIQKNKEMDLCCQIKCCKRKSEA